MDSRGDVRSLALKVTVAIGDVSTIVTGAIVKVAEAVTAKV